MRKFILPVAASVLSLAVLSGCNSRKDPMKTTTPWNTTAPTVRETTVPTVPEPTAPVHPATDPTDITNVPTFDPSETNDTIFDEETRETTVETKQSSKPENRNRR